VDEVLQPSVGSGNLLHIIHACCVADCCAYQVPRQQVLVISDDLDQVRECPGLYLPGSTAVKSQQTLSQHATMAMSGCLLTAWQLTQLPSEAAAVVISLCMHHSMLPVSLSYILG
jgi:hypothetical protein